MLWTYCLQILQGHLSNVRNLTFLNILSDLAFIISSGRKLKKIGAILFMVSRPKCVIFAFGILKFIYFVQCVLSYSIKYINFCTYLLFAIAFYHSNSNEIVTKLIIACIYMFFIFYTKLCDKILNHWLFQRIEEWALMWGVDAYARGHLFDNLVSHMGAYLRGEDIWGGYLYVYEFWYIFFICDHFYRSNSNERRTKLIIAYIYMCFIFI